MNMKVDGKRIRALRLDRSWSQEGLAERARVSLRTVQRMENEGIASLQSRRAVADALAVPASALGVVTDAADAVPGAAEPPPGAAQPQRVPPEPQRSPAELQRAAAALPPDQGESVRGAGDPSVTEAPARPASTTPRLQLARVAAFPVALILAFVAGGLASFLWLGGPREAGQAAGMAGRPAPAERLIVTVGLGDIEDSVSAGGSLRPRQSVPVYARASGELLEYHVAIGDAVAAGQALASIDAEAQILRVESARLELEKHRNRLSQQERSAVLAEEALHRERERAAAGVANDEALERAQSAVFDAQTELRNLMIDVEQTERALQREELQLGYTEPRAPIAGTVIAIEQRPGAILNAAHTAPTLLRIADLTMLTAEIDVPEAEVADLDPAMQVYLTTPGGGDRRWEGRLRQIDPIAAVNSNGVLYRALVDVDNADGTLYAGMTVHASFVASFTENVLTVPVAALLSTAIEGETRRAEVDVVMTDGATETREIVIGVMNRDSAEVVSGLEAGDRVVVGST